MTPRQVRLLEAAKDNLAKCDQHVAGGLTRLEALKKMGFQKYHYYLWRKVVAKWSPQDIAPKKSTYSVIKKPLHHVPIESLKAPSQVCIIMGDGNHIQEILNFMKANV